MKTCIDKVVLVVLTTWAKILLWLIFIDIGVKRGRLLVGSCFHGIHPFLHGFEVLFQNLLISVEFVELKGQAKNHISPTQRASFRLLNVTLNLWNSSQNDAIIFLLQANALEPIFIKGNHILIEQGCRPIGINISCPTCFFTRRTVCRNANIIGTLAPEDIALQLIQFAI